MNPAHPPGDNRGGPSDDPRRRTVSAETWRFADAIEWVLEPDLAAPIEKHHRWADRELRRARRRTQQAERRRQHTAQRPILGRLFAAVAESQDDASLRSDVSAADRADDTQITEMLDRTPGIVAFHHRRLAGMRSSIDHIAVTDERVIVIYSVRDQGRIQAREVGWLFRPDTRLYVGNHDTTTLVQTITQQGAALARALRHTSFAHQPIHGTLCFLDAQWPRFYHRPLTVGAVTCIWPAGLAELLQPATAQRLPSLPLAIAPTDGLGR